MGQEFYCLNFNSNNADLFVEVIGEYDDQKLMAGIFNPTDLEVKNSQGRKANDIVRLQDVFNFLISTELRNEMEAANLTGWKTYKIKSKDLDNSYTGFQCTGKCGILDRPKTSGFVTGYNFNIETWNGDDFFIPESTMIILCTEKAMNILGNRKITNIELENIKSTRWYNI
jgi:hypothetical protein